MFACLRDDCMLHDVKDSLMTSKAADIQSRFASELSEDDGEQRDLVVTEVRMKEFRVIQALRVFCLPLALRIIY